MPSSWERMKSPRDKDQGQRRPCPTAISAPSGLDHERRRRARRQRLLLAAGGKPPAKQIACATRNTLSAALVARRSHSLACLTRSPESTVSSSSFVAQWPIWRASRTKPSSIATVAGRFLRYTISLTASPQQRKMRPLRRLRWPPRCLSSVGEIVHCRRRERLPQVPDRSDTWLV